MHHRSGKVPEVIASRTLNTLFRLHRSCITDITTGLFIFSTAVISHLLIKSDQYIRIGKYATTYLRESSSSICIKSAAPAPNYHIPGSHNFFQCARKCHCFYDTLLSVLSTKQIDTSWCPDISCLVLSVREVPTSAK